MLNVDSHRAKAYLVLFSFFCATIHCAVVAEPKRAINTRHHAAKNLYLKGEADASNQKFSEALRKFQLLNFKYPDHPYHEQVQFYLIRCFQGSKRYADAMKAADVFMQKYPNSAKLPEIVKLRKSLEKRNMQAKSNNALSLVLVLSGVALCAWALTASDATPTPTGNKTIDKAMKKMNAMINSILKKAHKLSEEWDNKTKPS